MKRAFYEWGAISMLALAIACFGYWGVSKITAAADSKTSFGRRTFEASVSNGTVMLADQLNNGKMIDKIEKLVPVFPMGHKVIDQFRLSLPGFELHFITVANDLPIWRIEFSLLIPAAIMSLGAAFSIFEYRKVRLAMALGEKPTASSEPVANPLD